MAAPYIPQIRLYQDWLRGTRALSFDSYDALWRWSTTDLPAFWQSIWDYFDLRSPTPFRSVLAEAKMPGAKWFDGAQFNYAQQVLRHADEAHAAGFPAVIGRDEKGRHRELSWPELRRQVASLALHLREQGLQPGDRVAAYLPNIPRDDGRLSRGGQRRRHLERLRARHGDQRGAGPLQADRAQGADRL